MAKYKYTLEGLNCANCAAKIEAQIARMEGVASANVDFIGKTLTVQLGGSAAMFLPRAQEVVDSIEQGVKVSRQEEAAAETKGGFSTDVWIAAASVALFAVSFVLEHILQAPELWPAIGFGLSVLLAGWKVFISGFKSLLRLRLDENTLMTIAVIAAFCLGEFSEAAMVAILFNLGEILEDKAVSRSRRSIAHLAQIRPDTARLVVSKQQAGHTEACVDACCAGCDHTEHEHQHETHGHDAHGEDCGCTLSHAAPDPSGERVVDAREVEIGSVIAVHPFERIPLDGTVLSGSSLLDSSALTGESMPVEAGPGTAVLSGMMNGESLLTVQVTSDFSGSAASRIIDMVEESAARKGKAEKLITRFAAVYTPIVIALAVLLMAIPPLLGWGAFSTWFYRAMIFLVASCPCALVISVPLGFYAGIGAQSKNGVLVKGGKYIEVLEKPDAVVFDKTGTLTSGKLSVSQVETLGVWNREELLQLAASAEQYSSHPAAKALLSANNLPLFEAEQPKEAAGQGVNAIVNGKQVACGRKQLMDRIGVDVGTRSSSIFVAVDGVLAGCVDLADTLKPDAAEGVRRLKKLHVGRVVMLTGDNEKAAADAAAKAGVDEYHAGLLPEDKVRLMESIRAASGRTIFVGDGINDAPVLAASDCGVAMGLGTDAAIEASDVVLTADKPSKLADAVSLARRSMRVVRFNIVFALAVKAAVLGLAAAGFAPMWLAVFADVGVSILSVANATRVLRFQA
ncbi:MAG: heavy metal translocating P-type ATPase [Hydrogeniiclostridium mannosilyticum]